MPTTEIFGILPTASLVYSIACSGVSKAEVTPGRLSFGQSYFRLQKLHCTLQEAATGKCSLPNFFLASSLKQGWFLRRFSMVRHPFFVTG
jgi:hypothetical protein